VKLIRGSEEMRWMPSRYHFALFRLAGWLRLRNARIAGERDRILSLHRYQSGIEMSGVGFWTLLTVTCWFAGLLHALPPPAALLAGLPLAWISLQVMTAFAALCITPLVRFVTRRPGENNLALNSFAVMLMLVAAASWISMQRTWARFAAWQFLALVALNALAATLLFFLRDDVARLESSLGGETSASSSFSSP
jgi:hypothetical protein